MYRGTGLALALATPDRLQCAEASYGEFLDCILPKLLSREPCRTYISPWGRFRGGLLPVAFAYRCFGDIFYKAEQVAQAADGHGGLSLPFS